MINFIKRFAMLVVVAAFFILQSCSSDPDPVIKVGTAGFFVVNEGSFGAGNASISYYDRKSDVVTNNVFATKNGRALGDQAQSMTVFENKGYIVVQNSSKVEVINTDDFSSIATIKDGLESPRYFIGISSTKGYVSDWGFDGVTGTVKVVDLTTNKVTKTIATGKGANRMLKVGNLVYVANSGGYDKDNTVKIIDILSDAVTGSITTGDNPNSLQVDSNGNIWVLSGGNLVYNKDFSINESLSTKGSFSKITANAETLRLTVSGFTYSWPANLQISPDGTKLYYTFDDAIYTMATSSTSLPTSSFKTESYYGLAVDPFNGNIVGCNAPSFSAAGTVEVYNAAGSLQKIYTAGIGPNGCAFK